MSNNPIGIRLTGEVETGPLGSAWRQFCRDVNEHVPGWTACRYAATSVLTGEVIYAEYVFSEEEGVEQ